MVHFTYHIGRHDGGWAYRLDDVWSEPFPHHEQARAAARRATARQRLAGQTADILFQSGDGAWHREHVEAGERPDVDVAGD